MSKKIVPLSEESPWISAFCRPTAADWQHATCKGFIRNGTMAPRTLLLCECEDERCASDPRHTHSAEALADSKIVRPKLIRRPEEAQAS